MDYSQSVLEEIRAAAVDGLCRFPRGGVEIGGILLGSFRGGAVEVTGAQPVECSYAHGPSYTLDSGNEAVFRAALASIEGATVVGWYHSHTRSALAFTAEDYAAHRRLFTDPRQIAFVIRPEPFGTAEAAFFLPAEEGIQEHAPAGAVFAVTAGSIRDGASRRSLRPRHADAASQQAPAEPVPAHHLAVAGRLSRRRAELLAELGAGWDAEAEPAIAPETGQELPVGGFASEDVPAAIAGSGACTRAEFDAVAAPVHIPAGIDSGVAAPPSHKRVIPEAAAFLPERALAAIERSGHPAVEDFDIIPPPARIPAEFAATVDSAFVEQSPVAEPALFETAVSFAPEPTAAATEGIPAEALAGIETAQEPDRLGRAEVSEPDAASVEQEQPPAIRPHVSGPQPQMAGRAFPSPSAEPPAIADALPLIPAFEPASPVAASSIADAPPVNLAGGLVGAASRPATEPHRAPSFELRRVNTPVLRAPAAGPAFPLQFTSPGPTSPGRHWSPHGNRISRPPAARAAAIAAIVILSVAAVWYGLRPAHTVSNAPSLRLRISESAGQLQITWDRNAIPLQTARNGTVTIRDGGRSITVPFAPDKLRAGGLTYARTSEEVEVRLRVDGPVPAEESVRLFGPPVMGRPAAPARTQTPSPEPPAAEPLRPAEARVKLAETRLPAAAPEGRVRTDEPQEVPTVREAVPTVREAVPTRPFRASAMPQAANPAALPQPPHVQAAPQLASSAVSGVVPSVAPPQPPKESPKPAPAYSGPIAGRLIWVGRLARGAALSIEGQRASSGVLTGELPGVPVRISAYPARLSGGELRVYASSPTVKEVREAAGPQNGWNPTTYSWDARRSSDVLVTETPSPQNGWKGLAVRGNGSPVSVIIVDWRVAQP